MIGRGLKAKQEERKEYCWKEAINEGKKEEKKKARKV